MSPWLSDLFLSSQSDERLVRMARDGHVQAFSVIVHRYRRELLSSANRLGSDGRAEDVVQQTFLNAFAALQDGTEVKHLRGWLHAILRRNAARAPAPVLAHPEMAELAAVGAPLDEAIGQRMLAMDALSEIGQLPERQRTALVATALEGRSRAEVAGVLGLSEGAVRQLVHRARASIRSAVTAVTPLPLLRWLAARQSRGSDWSTPEMLAGAGGASSAAVAVKIGTIVVAGLGVAGAIAVQPRSAQRQRATAAPAAKVRPVNGDQAVVGSSVAGPRGLAGVAGAAGGSVTGAAASGGRGNAPASAPLTAGSLAEQHRGAGRDGSSGGDHGGSRGEDHGGSTRSDHGGSTATITPRDGGGSGTDGGTSGGTVSSEGGGRTTGSGSGSDGAGPGSAVSSSTSDGGTLSSHDGGSSDGGSSGSDGGRVVPTSTTSVS